VPRGPRQGDPEGGSLRPLLVLTPILAEALARAGFDKGRLRQALHARARLPARQIERYVGEWTNIVPGRPTLLERVKQGDLPAVYGESSDPDRLVPIVARAEAIMIAVSGDPLRTNAYAFVSNGMHGSPTTRRIRGR
jgi:hypothetical protein